MKKDDMELLYVPKTQCHRGVVYVMCNLSLLTVRITSWKGPLLLQLQCESCWFQLIMLNLYCNHFFILIINHRFFVDFFSAARLAFVLVLILSFFLIKSTKWLKEVKYLESNKRYHTFKVMFLPNVICSNISNFKKFIFRFFFSF